MKKNETSNTIKLYLLIFAYVWTKECGVKLNHIKTYYISTNSLSQLMLPSYFLSTPPPPPALLINSFIAVPDT